MATASIMAVLLLQAFNSFACYKHDLLTFLLSTVIFLTIPLLPAIVSLALPNPLPAVGACALFAPWLLVAYYTDCVRPYSGGDASMIYIAVLLWGRRLPSSVPSLRCLLLGVLASRSTSANLSLNPDASPAALARRPLGAG